MVTISLCMIVKNEEKILRRCLDSLKGLYDEAIIVDTGSTDYTKSIAKEYTDKVYDFEWTNDFAAARNFAISKASCDYFYMADADEVLDEANHEKFRLLKEILLPEIEIVQMRYVNQFAYGTVYNYNEEYRPKLYKRVRTYSYIDPIHEIVRTDPVVYDSEIDIIHMPESVHTNRDFACFEQAIQRDGDLSKRLVTMYAKELLISGTMEDLQGAKPYFEKLLLREDLSEDDMRVVFIVLAKAAISEGDEPGMFKYALKEVAGTGSSEICSILGAYFEDKKDYLEAAIWYYNARYETSPLLWLKSGNIVPLKGLIRVYTALGMPEEAESYEKELKETEKEFLPIRQ